MSSLTAETAVQEELQLYLAEKGVNSLFVKIVEQLLLEKPDTPVAFIVQFLLDSYPEETKDFCKVADIASKTRDPQGNRRPSIPESARMPSKRRSSDATAEEESDDSDEGDYVDELPSLPSRAKGTVGRRTSVSAGVLDEEDMGREMPVFEKSEEEKSRLRQIVNQNVLCSHLDEDEVTTIVDAFEKCSYPVETNIIEQGDTNAEHYFVLYSGKADVYKDGEKLNLVYTSGDGFGELALMYHAPRAATITTVEPCEVYRLDQVSFKVILMASAMKKRERYLQFLTTVPILNEMSKEELMVLADALRETTYKQGATIVEQGDPGDEFYIIADGVVAVERDGMAVSNLTEGKYFGEIALLTSKKRQATVTAKSDVVKVLSVHRKVFQRVLGPLSDILSRNMDAYSEWLTK